MDMNVICLGLCIFANCLSDGANVSREPRNIVYLSNTTVIITCEVSENDFSYIDWSHEYRNSSWTQRLSNNTGGNASTNYLMIKTTNGENLVIDSIRLRDAGVYYCIMTTTTGMLKEVGGHVIVLASDPTCDVENVTVMEDSYMRLRCNVTFGGFWKPVMEWTLFGLLGQEKINNDSIIISAPESQQYTSMTVSLQILAKPHHNGISLVCTTYFDRNDMPVNHKVNNNTPDYNHTWKSPNISVLYGPISVTIYPASDTLYPGDKLTCSALGNPEPQYKWIGNETAYSNVESQIDIVQTMVSDHPYVFSCEAQNSVSQSFARITFTVRNETAQSDSLYNTAMKVIVILGITNSVSITVCFVVILKRKKVIVYTNKETTSGETGLSREATLSGSEYMYVPIQKDQVQCLHSLDARELVEMMTYMELSSSDQHSEIYTRLE